MSCNSCYKKYGLFTRETGCGNCGFSFCSKCCKSEIAGVKKKVCLGCFNKSKPNVPQLSRVPEKDCIVEPRSLIPEEPIPEINPEDVQLQKRLEELKRKDAGGSDGGQPITDVDIRQRLAKLQDRPYTEDKPNRDIFHIDQRSEQEKVNDLVEQYHKEAALNAASDPVRDLEERINKLRGVDPTAASSHSAMTPQGNKVEEDDEDDDKKFVKKILAEAMLDAKLNFTDEERELMEEIPKPPLNRDDLDELPWCTICNEDAKIRCMDCDGELYCNSCFREIHQDDEDYRGHVKKAYQKPKKDGVLSSSDDD